MEAGLTQRSNGIYTIPFSTLVDAAADGLCLAIKEGWALPPGMKWEASTLKLCRDAGASLPGWYELLEVYEVFFTKNATLKHSPI